EPRAPRCVMRSPRARAAHPVELRARHRGRADGAAPQHLPRARCRPLSHGRCRPGLPGRVAIRRPRHPSRVSSLPASRVSAAARSVRAVPVRGRPAHEPWSGEPAPARGRGGSSGRGAEEMRRILVTGGAGFIGSNFVRHLAARYPDYQLTVVDALTYAGSVENLPEELTKGSDTRIRFWYGNVRNGELLHTLVAETHVTRSIYDNLTFFETDVLGTQVVANAVVKYQKSIDRFIHISSSEVYGTARTPLMDEEHPLLPMSPYASAKAGADRLVYSY